MQRIYKTDKLTMAKMVETKVETNVKGTRNNIIKTFWQILKLISPIKRFFL